MAMQAFPKFLSQIMIAFEKTKNNFNFSVVSGSEVQLSLTEIINILYNTFLSSPTYLHEQRLSATL
jgi:hypothetical protein